jgi:predicted permease
MNTLLQDIRYALRQLRKSPGFTLAAVTVLALGLGANIAVFTVLDGVLLRPLPYEQPDRVVEIKGAGTEPYYMMSYANMIQLRDAVGARMRIGAVLNESMASVVGPGGRVQVHHVEVTASLIPMLGVQPLLGRAFRDEENEPGRNRVVLLSEDTWRKLYNADPQIVGKTLTIKEQAYTILGVMPRGFSFPFNSDAQVWSPGALDAASQTAMSGEHQVWGDLYARVPDGMMPAQLADQLSRTQAEIAKQAPGDGPTVPARIAVTSYQQSLNQQLREPLLLLYGVVFGIWALACLNVASLILVRAVSRNREQAVRAALGASRRRLLQQAVVESLLLSGIGGVFGLLIGQTALKLLSHQIDRNLRQLSGAVHLEWRVIACLAALTLLTAVVVGVFPALRAMRRNVQDSLHGITTTASASQNRTRESLVVAQLALTLVFLVGAGLFLRTIHALRSVPLGFTQQNVLTGGIILNGGGQLEKMAGSHGDINIVRTSYLPLLDRLRAIPGVKVAALSSVLPLRAEFAVTVSGGLDHKDVGFKQEPRADGRLASPGLVDAMGIPMVRGRFFTEDDSASAPPVVVVNQAFVNKYLPNQDPLGHTFSMGKGWFADMHIVGVIGDVKQRKVTDATRPEIYFCLAQTEPGTPLYGIATAFIQVAIRGAVPADSLRAQFDKALHEVAPDAATVDVKTIHEAVEDSFGSQTLIAHLLESFAALALMIASVGLYGLLSFAVAQRTREIGLRIALGAPQGNILNLILRRALLLVAVGLTIGGALAWFAVRFAGSYIYGVQAHDGLTFAAVVLVLAVASFVSAWLPARRAATVDPILALRSE